MGKPRKRSRDASVAELIHLVVFAHALLLIADGKSLDEFSDGAIPGSSAILANRYSPDQYLLKPI